MIFTAAPPAVLTRHCRHARSVIGREYPPALRTERARPPARNAVGGRTHARRGRTREYSALPPVCRVRRCVARGLSAADPSPSHTRAHMHTHALPRTCVRGCARRHRRLQGTCRLARSALAACAQHCVYSTSVLRAIVIALDAARHSWARLLPLIPPVSRRGRVHVNVDHRSYGGSAYVRRGRVGRMQRWATSAA